MLEMDNKTIDINKICIQNKILKLRNKKAERDLLSLISEKGVLEPLLGIFKGDTFSLVDGFKRYRCCKKLHIDILPIEVIAIDEANAFIKILKLSNSKTLHILEQAKFIKELYEKHSMTMESIGYSLEKSRFWVSSRIKLLKEITPLMKEKIFSGAFPVWNAMGILHQVKRLSIAGDQEIDEFVTAVSSKGLSVKDIDLLANGYFKGGDEFKYQIKNGNFTWSINKLKDVNTQSDTLNDNEKRLLKDLEIASKYISRIIFKLPQLQNNNNFHSTGGLLAEGILNKSDKFKEILTLFIQEVKSD
jgi:ParB/RepB/Spo0J family partition protein